MADKRTTTKKAKAPKKAAKPEAPVFQQVFKTVDDLLRKDAGCTSELDYAEQSSWLLFLKYLDALEQDREVEARLEGKKYTYILDSKYRWSIWAAPRNAQGAIDYNTALLPTYKRFPTDAEFSEALRTSDLYNFRRTPYFLKKLENFGRKEEVSTSEYTIEHIMPQNENLSTQWQEALGKNWKEIQKRYLHTLGNLTLTGYNPEYSDKPFAEKRDMEGGFRVSPLRLNQGLGQLESWNSIEIEKRGQRLADQALKIWKKLELSDDAAARYRARFIERDGFDWSMTHAILAAIPAGNWTSYHQLAEAVGTAAQALGNHMTSCGACPNPHRVLTWDGRVADSFRWGSSDEKRHPSEILLEEGIRFEDKHADKKQQLLLDDLLALVGEID